LEIPGKACEFLSSVKYAAIFEYLESLYKDKYKFKRIDLAFDYVEFTPQQVYEAVLANRLRLLAKRETLRQENSSLLARADGQKGTQTVYLGSNQSNRMIRVYNRRGFTRLELQAKDDRANLIARDLFTTNSENWYALGISHLRDYADFFEPWWDQFIASQGRAYRTLASPEDQSLLNSIAWVENQVSQTLSVIEDVRGRALIEKMIELGRKKRGKRFDGLIERSKKQ
jgi:DNA relaxase NicK